VHEFTVLHNGIVKYTVTSFVQTAFLLYLFHTFIYTRLTGLWLSRCSEYQQFSHSTST